MMPVGLLVGFGRCIDVCFIDVVPIDIVSRVVSGAM